MAAIEFNRGIERILPYLDPQKTVGLPEKSNVAPEGERITNYLETYFSENKKVLPLTDGLMDFVRPHLGQVSVTAPWYYNKCFYSVLEEWRRLRKKIESIEDQKTIEHGIALLDVVEADMDLLNNYVLCLQKV